MLRPTLRFTGHTNPPTRTLVAAESRRLISTSDDRSIRVWDLDTGQSVHVIDDMDPGTRQEVHIWAVSPNGEFLATGAPDFTTKAYSIVTGARLSRLSKPRRNYYNSAEGLVFSTDGRHLAGSQGQRIEVYRTDDWTLIHTLKGHTSRITSMVFSPCGRHLATTGGKQIKLWDINAGREVRTLIGHGKIVNVCGFSPDGETLLTASRDKTVRIWEVETGELVGTYSAHDDEIWGLAVSPMVPMVASWNWVNLHDWRLKGSGDVHLWSRETLETIKCERLGWGRQLAFSPDGQWLVYAAENAGVFLINPKAGDIVFELPPSDVATFMPDSSGVITAEANDLVLWSLLST